MGIFDMFTSDACNISGRNNGLESWSWEEYEVKKIELSDKIVLVDMIGQPLEGSVTISDELFSGKYLPGTIFALYCHSGGTSGYLQMQLSPQLPQYTFVNIKGGIMSLRR
ncbi:MAG: hypothetical protein PHZ26_01610 [Candidatus Gracilibacteria bacterium]|nr:hypothetical protein [Candidatus Gracilibacteria bacterium]MDD2908430.1 hypothetical protein [Candidatus Gracilibacteria bacterium]